MKEDYQKTIQEISELYSVDTICITKLLTIINSKLKDLENNSNLNKFLSNILTTFEYEVLSNINNISLNKDIQTILNMIITKINLLYKYQNLNIDKESLKDFLQTILSNNEYRNISLRYGLFNSPRTKLPINTLYRLSINDKKILHKIAIFLNIENTKNKSI